MISSFSKRTKHFKYKLLLLFILPFLVYLPAFTADFGMHNDYRMLPGNFSDRKIFSEADHLYLVGRGLCSRS